MHRELCSINNRFYRWPLCDHIGPIIVSTFLSALFGYRSIPSQTTSWDTQQIEPDYFLIYMLHLGRSVVGTDFRGPELLGSALHCTV